MTSSARRNRAAGAAAATALGLTVALGGCSSGTDVPGHIADDIEAAGLGRPTIDAQVTNDVSTVSVQVPNRTDPTAELAVARVVWQSYPARIDVLVVMSPNDSHRFLRADLAKQLGARNTSLDAAEPVAPTSPPAGKILVTVGALAAAGGGAFVLIQRSRRRTDLDRRLSVPGMEDLNPTFMLGARSGLERIFPGLGTRAAAEPPTATAPDPSDEADALDDHLGRDARRGATITVEDVLDLGLLLGSAGIDRLWLGGAWARCAHTGEAPSSLPSVELVVAEELVSAVVHELAGVGFRSTWNRNEQASGVVRLTDQNGRLILIRAVQVVDDPTAGDPDDGDHLAATRIAAADCGTGMLAGTRVPCVLPDGLTTLADAGTGRRSHVHG